MEENDKVPLFVLILHVYTVTVVFSTLASPFFVVAVTSSLKN
jgi:hypothetical protein